jgi:hypothetical protein
MTTATTAGRSYAADDRDAGAQHRLAPVRPHDRGVVERPVVLKIPAAGQAIRRDHPVLPLGDPAGRGLRERFPSVVVVRPVHDPLPRARSWHHASVGLLDALSAEGKEDVSRLLGLLLPHAQDLLSRNGEFYPFGGSISTTGEVALESAAVEESQPDSQELLELLYAGDHQRRHELRAAGWATNVRLGDDDAVRVELELREGFVVAFFYPYVRNGSTVVIEDDKAVADDGEQHVWT